LTSFHSGADERFGLEDSFFNQLTNWKGESQGAILHESAVLIGGLPVELRTGQMWEDVGFIPRGTVANAPPATGWKP
jgi:hypothetical protein